MQEAVVVTGAGGGIGRACVSRLTALGFAALVPSSVRRPVKRVDGEATATPPSPRWATTLALAGGALIIVGFALRWLGS